MHKTMLKDAKSTYFCLSHLYASHHGGSQAQLPQPVDIWVRFPHYIRSSAHSPDLRHDWLDLFTTIKLTLPNKRWFYTLLLTLSVLSVFLIIIFSSFFSYLYSINYYDRAYSKYNVYDIFTRETALFATENMLGFFRNRNELDMSFFNEKERLHLLDVKNLIAKARLIYGLGFIFAGLSIISSHYFVKKHTLKFLSDAFFYSGIFTISAVIILAFLYFFSGFDIIFLKFHEILFTGNYSFDPSVSNMKAMLPDGFFYDVGFAILISIIMKAILLVVSGYVLRKKTKV